MRRISLICLAVILILAYLAFTYGEIRVVAQFKDLEPFQHALPVYYKGFKLGHTSRVYPTDDFKETNVHLRLRLKGVKLPDNISAMVRRSNDKDYIELVYPKEPSGKMLKRNSIIEGMKGQNFENYLREQAQNGGLEEIKSNLNKTLTSASGSFDALADMFNMLTLILEDVRPSIKTSAKNLELTTQNLADTSNSLKITVQKGYIDNALGNIEMTSKNLVLTTDNFSGFSGSLKQESSIMLNCLLKNLNVVVNNINEIVVGLGNTLKKRFGGLRLIFGKSVSCE